MSGLCHDNRRSYQEYQDYLSREVARNTDVLRYVRERIYDIDREQTEEVLRQRIQYLEEDL